MDITVFNGKKVKSIVKERILKQEQPQFDRITFTMEDGSSLIVESCVKALSSDSLLLIFPYSFKGEYINYGD